MDKFTASNGVSVKLDGALLFGASTHTTYVAASESQVQALREFFQAERDEELGRWRSEGAPDWVAREVERSTDGRRCVEVLNERTFQGGTYNDRVMEGGTAPTHSVAREYLEAHPEPVREPWHDARPGQIWTVATAGGARQDLALVNTDAEFVIATGETWPVDANFIVSAHLIWSNS
jgi:hypothetical protein